MKTYIVTAYSLANGTKYSQIIRAISREFAIAIFKCDSPECKNFEVTA